nr:lITAF domain-containing protein isoform X3 [Rattus norvegicus]
MEGSFKLSHGQAPLQREVDTRSPALCTKDITMAVAAVRDLSPQWGLFKGTSGTRGLSTQNLEPVESAQGVILKQRTLMAQKENQNHDFQQRRELPPPYYPPRGPRSRVYPMYTHVPPTVQADHMSLLWELYHDSGKPYPGPPHLAAV